MIADHIIEFNQELSKGIDLPAPFELLNPFTDPITVELSDLFYRKYYNDDNIRTLLLGINPGRFGAGVTGVCFTDPIFLQDHLGIANDLEKRHELSSQFIHEMIAAYGGPDRFYSRNLISSVCPLGFVKEGKNINYYDDKDLESAVRDYIFTSLKDHLKFNVDTSKVYCIGGGQNLKFLERYNTELQLFDEIIPLPHPRWVLQYRRKRKDEFIQQYLDALL